jgi:ubiquinol-cytochrome c reductase cytochrome c1 subunit
MRNLALLRAKAVVVVRATGLWMMAVALVSVALPSPSRAAGAPISEAPGALHWDHWKADSEIFNVPSLQRGARNFMAYCSGCHSLKYMRYSRMAEDLKIPEQQLEQNLVLPGDNKNAYILTRLAAADGEAWFGKAPPDLSLITRAKGSDYVYQFLKTFYADEKSATGVNNLALAGTAMPHVLADLQGVQTAVFRNEERPGEGGAKPATESRFFDFEPGTTGTMSAEQYDAFVRDVVNFLEYVGEPAQATRRSVGVWVILFLLAFTGIAYLLKQEYWKDVPVKAPQH